MTHTANRHNLLWCLILMIRSLLLHLSTGIIILFLQSEFLQQFLFLQAYIFFSGVSFRKQAKSIHYTHIDRGYFPMRASI